MADNEELAERLRVELKSVPGVIEKKMLSRIGFLIDGNMACGVNKQDLIVCLTMTISKRRSFRHTCESSI